MYQNVTRDPSLWSWAQEESVMTTDRETYERFDGCYGRVTGRCLSGAYLTLENGEEAFAYNFGSLLPGTRVLCSVQRMPTEDKRMLVSIDSVVCSPMVA